MGKGMAKSFSWAIFVLDFEQYPFDREHSYDFVKTLAMLLFRKHVSDERKERKEEREK